MLDEGAGQVASPGTDLRGEAKYPGCIRAEAEAAMGEGDALMLSLDTAREKHSPFLTSLHQLPLHPEPSVKEPLDIARLASSLPSVTQQSLRAHLGHGSLSPFGAGLLAR